MAVSLGGGGSVGVVPACRFPLRKMTDNCVHSTARGAYFSVSLRGGGVLDIVRSSIDMSCSSSCRCFFG
ncbi:MAG TPA: hypothetical protein ACQGQH_04195 [Xylella sp.]